MSDDFISEEEKSLFRKYLQGVKPLNKKTPIRDTPISVPAIQQSAQTIPAPQKEYYLSDYIATPVFSETPLHYGQKNLSKTHWHALKKGELRWSARLDLHGFKTDEARDALIQFIRTQTQKKQGCLLIIHGKGGYQGGPPVIKNLINRWLPQLNEVLAFCSAQAKDGGNGAVYVLLRHR